MAVLGGTLSRYLSTQAEVRLAAVTPWAMLALYAVGLMRVKAAPGEGAR